MTATFNFYGLFAKGQLNGAHPVDFDTHTLKVTLHTSSYTPDLDAHEFYTDLANELSTAGGYTSGGKALTTKVVGYNTGSNFAYFDADDTTWSPLTATFRYAVVRYDTGTGATSPVIFVIDFGTNQTPSAVDFTMQWAAIASGGVFKLVA